KKERACSHWATLARWGGNRSSESHPARHVCTPKTSWLEAHDPRMHRSFAVPSVPSAFPFASGSEEGQLGGKRGKGPPCRCGGGGLWLEGSRWRSQPRCAGEGRGCFGHTCRFGVGGTVIAESSAANIPLRVFWEKFSVQSGPDSLLGAKIRNIALQPPQKAHLPWTTFAVISIIYIRAILTKYCKLTEF
ncbi:hypothetical protein AS28_13195, partial [Pygoscelis adeliae]